MEEIKAKYHELLLHPNIVEKGLDFLKVPGRGGITGRYMGRGNSLFLHLLQKYALPKKVFGQFLHHNLAT